MKEDEKNIVSSAKSIMACLTAIFLLGLVVFAQNSNTKTAKAQIPAVESGGSISQPSLTGYKSIKIGSSADEVRDKLGKAEIEDKDGFFYRFSDDEFAQIQLDEQEKVRVIAVTYSGDNAPEFTDVFSEETKPEAKPDGSIYKLVRYPQAGHWVAYSRTSGEKPTITVTIQKLWYVK